MNCINLRFGSSEDCRRSFILRVGKILILYWRGNKRKMIPCVEFFKKLSILNRASLINFGLQFRAIGSLENNLLI